MPASDPTKEFYRSLAASLKDGRQAKKLMAAPLELIESIMLKHHQAMLQGVLEHCQELLTRAESAERQLDELRAELAHAENTWKTMRELFESGVPSDQIVAGVRSVFVIDSAITKEGGND